MKRGKWKPWGTVNKKITDNTNRVLFLSFTATSTTVMIITAAKQFHNVTEVKKNGIEGQ